ncbi:hypothetical protein P775_25640 [Puniceibacterium antarcticum]|uniref:Uncharacterized protein n=1 Tax=Puniceibacterium antarcticum TaxID=1206336 RepID=A0A2G8R1Z6_9RHOB|nr:hypothetical protein [Puniceibacterium antarcticum]PIL15564.1 hypothetical protein P775_25640 [Puniceibacterium antarcticum]
MADSNDVRKAPLGLYDLPERGGVTGIELTALACSLIWLGISGGYFLLADAEGTDGIRVLLTMMTLVLPVAMIWVAATAARASRVMREESLRLQAAIDAIRQANVSQAQSGKADTAGQSLSRKLDDIAAAQKKMEAALGMSGVARGQTPNAAPAPRKSVPAGSDQPTLALGTPAEALNPPLSNGDLIRALNFPDSAEDKAGFTALRSALKDRPSAQLVQASQDVLTLLSQDGIYMDDLHPAAAGPDAWRRFASGERGQAISALGGIRDRASLALASGRMKQDPIFRDAAHHFIRLFDKSLVRFESGATDADISDYADTRTARAFMLLGRVAGTFD